ncbi:MAG: helix-turn-helix domain-containing protein [Candidatus Methylacidiphilales bacterium]|nr:helix-turn-helix domain-containing protein [Candidatus Methylacidiphilales bacterium]
MKIPATATSFCPPASILSPGEFLGARLRHTYRPDGSRDWLLIYTTGGSGLYRFPQGEFRSTARDVTIYRSGVFQEYMIAPGAKRWDLLYAHFVPKQDWLPWIAWNQLSPGLYHLTLQDADAARRVTALLREVIRHHRGQAPSRQAFAQNALEKALLWCDSVNPQHTVSQPDPRVRRAADFLISKLNEPFDEEKLGHAAGLSPSRLRHLFRLQMKDSPRAYQEKLRLGRAQELLAMSRQTIGEIALELGFESAFYFTLRFKKHTGESPRAYRQRITRM